MGRSSRMPQPTEPPLLSPASAAAARATQQRAHKPGEVSRGALRVTGRPTVIQATDLADAAAPAARSSWLRRHQGGGAKAKAAAYNSVCMLLRMASSAATWPAMATSAALRGDSVFWNEEFLFESVSSNDELQLVCVDRLKNEPYASLPLRGGDMLASCPGFVGKVLVPLIRLPEGEEIEQWYPLAPREAYLSLRTALRVSLCFTPDGSRTRSARAESNVVERPLRPPPHSSRHAVDASRSPQQPPPSPLNGAGQPGVSFATGVVDYAIIVGSRDASESTAGRSDAGVVFRYPPTDRSDFPLPTKVEWFCFPDGPEVVEQVERPRPKLFSFVLVGGADGLSRCYAACLMIYHRSRDAAHVWRGTCVTFLTRLPLLDQIFACLLSFVHEWLTSCALAPEERLHIADKLLVDLCHGVLTPIRGVFGVEVCLPTIDRLQLVLPTNVTIYDGRSSPEPKLTLSVRTAVATSNHRSEESQRRGFGKFATNPAPSHQIPHQPSTVALPPLVYSLLPLFQRFDVKSVIEIAALMLCEYRVLVHSTQRSVLSPVAEGLCALIYPFRWQHPYVPILPRVLSEYLQAPLPYILGIHSSWLPDLLEGGRPEHLVIVDVDRGSVQRHDSGPVLPARLTKALLRRVKRLLHPEQDDDQALGSHQVNWSEAIERQIRAEFVCFLVMMLRGYRDCLFFVNQKLPVFNKRRFFESNSTENEAMPFLTRMFCTQAFQAFLENHNAPELNAFHAVYLALSRASEGVVWPQSCPACLSMATPDDSRGNPRTPVYRMESVYLDSSNSAPRDEAAIEKMSRLVDNLLESNRFFSETLSDASGAPSGLSGEARGTRYAEIMNRSLDIKDVAEALGVSHALLEERADWLRRPHDANQQHALHANPTTGIHSSGSSSSLSSGVRCLTKDEERMELLLHKCLTSVFTSDDQLSPEEIKACETHFKNQYARDLFVLILMQPGQQYTDTFSSALTSTWYSPKGSGSCIGEPGFRLLVRLASALMDHCATHEDFTNARGMLQVSGQYYRIVEEKHAGAGFAKKEYLVQLLRLRSICRSLDMWQHAFSREIDAALLAAGDAGVSSSLTDAGTTVSDEIFFSVIGGLIYDMLTVDVPVGNVQTFVAVMCSTYQKERELRDTLKQLVENVFRAVELSKDAPQAASPMATLVQPTPPMQGSPPAPSTRDVSPQPAPRAQYDLDTVIRRKMSVQETPFTKRPLSTPSPSRRNGERKQDSASLATPVSHQSWSMNGHDVVDRAPSLLYSQSSPVTSLSVYLGRVACGLADPAIALIDPSHRLETKSTVAKLEGHSDAVVAVEMQGQTLVSGSRDGTLRAWDLKASAKKRHHLFGFLSSHHDASGPSNGLADGDSVDGATVSRRSLVLRGHGGAVTCLEIGRQLSTDRAIVASGSVDSTIRLWDTSKEQSVAVLGGSGASPSWRGAVSSLRYLAHFDCLVSGVLDDFALKAWDLGTCTLRSCVPAHRGRIRDIQVTGERLVTAASDRVAKVWDARFRDGVNYSHALRGHGGPVLCVSLGGPADPSICTGSADGVVRVWDLRFVQKGPRLALAAHQGPVTCLQRDFTRLVSAGEDGVVRVWDVHSGACGQHARAHQAGVSCMALHGSSVFSGAWDGSVRLWDIEGGDRNR